MEILKDKKLIAFLLCNFFINTILLSTSSESGWARQTLWPFCQESIFESYDKSEFLLYGVGPIILAILVTLIKTEKK